MTEQIIADNELVEILAFHHSHFIEPGLRLKELNLKVDDYPVDLLFSDISGRELYVDVIGFPPELCGFKHPFRMSKILRDKFPGTRYMHIRQRIPSEIKAQFDSQNIEYREYDDADYLTYLRQHDPSFFSTKASWKKPWLNLNSMVKY